jgi:branched-chain amino acid transport system ATP-binding protein
MGLCHVPEGRGVFRSLSVRENLRLQAKPGQEKAAVERAVATFPILGQRLGQPAGTLSGGEQQMLALSPAYVRDPKLVLVDEASLGLAPVIVDEIFHFLERFRNEGRSLLLVDQFVSRALAIADKAYVLNKGALVFGGAPDDLRRSDVFQKYLGGT